MIFSFIRVDRLFRRRGQGRGELCFPVGIVVDTSLKKHRVSVGTSEGQFGRNGEGPGEFRYINSEG